MNNQPSPLETLAAFAIVFAAGVVSTATVTIPRQSRGHSGCEPLKAAVRGR